ncbi:MAG: system Fe-S cluster assembly protein [Gammaproteobacteria bacterium]|jgi:FeS assembly SUF system protein|nr:system Fe-S cluster assembly protein [Gammaproteobacteria bacterium]
MKEDPIWGEFMTEDPEHVSDLKEDKIPFSPVVSEHPLSAAIVEMLKTIYDPEIPVNIYELGLIYRVTIDESNHVHIQMTLTTPGCPVAQTFPDHIRQTIEGVEGVNGVEVEIVWDPPWTQDNMTEEAKLMLGLL